ncbi:MAG: hypothetical protein R3B83_04065 [Nitrospirales bacterium]|nr:hypothetical protein [Nitrospirales bacterium]
MALGQPRAIRKVGKVTSHDLMEFSTHMSTLLGVQGCHCFQALYNLGHESPNHHLRVMLQAVHHQVEAGSTSMRPWGNTQTSSPRK